MHGYSKNNLFDEKTVMIVKKGKSWTNEALIKAYKMFLNRKTNPKKRNKKLLSKNFKENILEDQKIF